MKHFLQKKKNASVGCIYIKNCALRQISMGVTGHRHGCQHCFLTFLCMHIYAKVGFLIYSFLGSRHLLVIGPCPLGLGKPAKYMYWLMA